MAVSSLSTLRTRVMERATISVVDPDTSTLKVTAAVNSALRQVTLEHDWPWLQQTATLSVVADTAFYPVPADWLRTIHITDPATGDKLLLSSLESLDRLGTLKGPPSIYCVYSSAILLGPTPSAATSLRHRYIRLENTLTADADTPLIPVEYEEGVIEYASFLVLRHMKESARARECRDAYINWVNRARDNIRQGREPVRVQHRLGGWL